MSPSSSRPLPPDALLVHRQWVRELARRLVADASAADDLEQQAWLAALRSPPRHGGSPKAWLGTLLRNWLHKTRRGEERRTRREHVAARREPTPSTAEIVAEADAHRRVVDAVFALAEPFKTTVLLRFFEDLPFAEVAARTGVPIETARSRIRRALELLRAALDAESRGDRRAWVVALAPLAKQGAWHVGAQAGLGGIVEALVMGAKHKVAVVAAVLLFGGATAYWVSSDRLFPFTDDAVARSEGVAARAEPAATEGDLATARAEVGERTLQRTLAPVVVEVRTWSGASIAGALVEAFVPPDPDSLAVQDSREPRLVAQATTGATGSVAFADLAAGHWHFVAQKDGHCRTGTHHVVLRDGIRTDPVVIHLGAGYALEGLVLAAGGRAVEGATVTAYPTSSPLVRPRTTTDARGHYRLELLAAGPTHVGAALPGGTVSTVETIQVPEVARLDIVLRTGGILTGKVTEKDTGRAVAGARVHASTSHTGSYKPTAAAAVTDAQGRYVIDTMGEGLIHAVTAAKNRYVQVLDLAAESFDVMIPFRDGGTWTRDLVLGRGGRLLVTVRGPDGPLAGAKLTAYAAHRRDPPAVVTDAQGRGVFAVIPPGRTLVEARATGFQQPGFPASWWAVVNDQTARSPWLVDVADGGQTSLELALSRSATIMGRVLAQDDSGLEGVLVNHAGAADATGAAVTDAGGSFRLPGARSGVAAPLSLTKSGYVAAGQVVATTPATGDLTGVVFRMAVAPRVRGTVTAPGGTLGEAYVQVSIVPDHEQEWLTELRWASAPREPVAADGTYDVALAGAEGRFAVRVVATRHPAETSAPLTITPGRDSYRVDLQLDGGAALAGRVVVFGGSEAVPGARVKTTWLAPGVDRARVVRAPDGPPVLAVSDGAGRFSIERLRPGRHELRVGAEGFLEESVEVVVPHAGELVVSLAPALTLEGRVEYADGRPVAAAQISAEPQPGNRSMSMSIEQVTSSAPDGRFKVPRLQAGQYRIRVIPPRTGFANFRHLQTGVVAAGTRDVRIVVEEGATISGTVRDAAGRGLARVNVGAQSMGGRERLGVETLLDGSFTLTGLEDGASYTLTINQGGSGFNRYASLQRGNVAAGATGLEFMLTVGLSVEGVLVDSAGKPVGGIYLSAAPVGSEVGSGPMAWTAPDGKFEIRGLEPGRYRIAATPWFSQDLFVAGGDEVVAGATGLTLTATEGARITGVVLDETGAPLPGAEVTAEAEQAGTRGGSFTRSRPDGAFGLSGLLPGAPFRVTARARGRVPGVQRDVPAGSTGLRLEPAKGLEVQGRLVDARGQAARHVNLRFVHAETGARAAARTDADGRFTASGLVPGSYSVEASAGTAEKLVVKPCGTVHAGQRDLELRLPADR